jgi:Protein of unknown function (DUF2971)
MSETVTRERHEDSADHPQFATFFKYCSDDCRLIKGIFEDHTMRFTQPAALNDPLEFYPAIRFRNPSETCRHFICNGEKFPSEKLWLHIRLIEQQLNRFGVLSLTKTPNSFDMWNLYANGHKGFLLEFAADFNTRECMRAKDGTVYEVREVNYVDEYAINVDDLTGSDGRIPATECNEQVFYSKTSRWATEREYRMVRALADLPGWRLSAGTVHRDQRVHLFDFTLDCLVSVTFGACMPIPNKKRIINACEGANIQFLQAWIRRGREDTHSVAATNASNFPNLVQMADSGFVLEQDDAEESNMEPIVIESLNDLPYYHGNEEWVHEYLENTRTRLGM